MAATGSLINNGQKTKRRAPSSTRWVIAGLVLVVVIGGIIALVKAHANKDALAGIKTAQVTQGSLVQTVESTGTVTAETGADVKIGAQINGTISHLYTDIGQTVKAGQVVATIADPTDQATLVSAQQNLAQANTHYQQQLEEIGMTHTQLSGAYEQAGEAIQHANAERAQAVAGLASAQAGVKTAQATVNGAGSLLKTAQANLRSAQASAQLQPAQTSTDIANAQAALSTSQANLRQTQDGADLQINTAQAALAQAQSNVTLAAANLQRQQTLLTKGYVSQQDVDAAQNQNDVAQQAVKSAQYNLDLTRQKVTDDLQTAQNQVTQAQAALAAAQAETYSNVVKTEAVNAAEASAADAQSNVEQAQSQLAASRENVKTAQAQVQSADSDIRNAQAAQKVALGNMTQDVLKQRDVQAAYQAALQAKAQVDGAAAELDKANIYSPIAGTVIALTEEQGETVAAQLSTPTLIEVVDLSKLEVDAYVDETDIAKLKLGMPAAVDVDAYPKAHFTGRITKISSAATIQDNVVTYDVTVTLDGYPVGKLKPTMTSNVTFTISSDDNVLLVPNEALKQADMGGPPGAQAAQAQAATGAAHQGPAGPGLTAPATATAAGKGPGQGKGKGKRAAPTQVVITLNNGKPAVVNVTTGPTDGTNTEILSGLKVGDTVVLAGFDKLNLSQFASGAKLPGFLTRGPLGTGGGGGHGH